MKPLNLLIIEDEESQLILYRDTIEQYNKKGEIKIEYRECIDFEEGRTALLSPYFDAAIIDLKLSKKVELEGIPLVEQVYKKIRVPIFVISGSIPQIDHIPENALFKKRKRTGLLYSDIIDEIVGIYKTGITSFLKPSGIIDQKLTEIFWNNLAVDLNIWVEKNNETTLLRYIFSHFQEHLNINIDGDFEEYDPSEVYIKPPIKKNIHTGDLVRFETLYYLILTPACDIVIHYKPREGGFKDPIRKAEKMLLVHVKEFDLEGLCKNAKGILDKNKIGEYVNNKQYRYHYLPPLLKNKGFLIDFQDLKSVYCNTAFERIASISSPFIKDIISRFSNYYSRQGQPTFGQTKIIDSLLEK